jgi:hypothetical protein
VYVCGCVTFFPPASSSNHEKTTLQRSPSPSMPSPFISISTKVDSIIAPKPVYRNPHMIDSLVVPVRVDLGELGGNPVVLAHHEQVHHTQHRLLVHPAQHRSLTFTYKLYFHAKL